jgi:hypothetical protein
LDFAPEGWKPRLVLFCFFLVFWFSIG